MQFPLGFSDISLWLAAIAMIVLTTAELIQPYFGSVNLLVNRSRLRNAALALAVLFILTMLIRVFEIVRET